MGIVLKKGGSFNLSKKEPGLEKIMIGLGWEVLQGNQLDLDASVFMLGANGKLPQDEYFIFYNNLKSPDGAVQHTGDNRTGAGDGDDEMILVNLPAVSTGVNDVDVVVSIHDAVLRNHNFGLLKDAYIRIVDVTTDREILRYDLDENYPLDTEVMFGKLHRVDGDWMFNAIGMGSNKGLNEYVNTYA